MATLLPSPTSSPSPVSPTAQSPSPSPSNPNHPSLAPLVTSHPRRPNPQRPPPSTKDRLSTYSNVSNLSQRRSRPQSQALGLVFQSSLNYTSVRDFAFPNGHPLHYGPPPEASRGGSGTSTPASEAHRRLSDPARTSWDHVEGGWSTGPWGGDGSMAGELDPHVLWQDGPPWSEDEDLQSPVVVSSRHKKHKSSGGALGSAAGHEGDNSDEEADADVVMPALAEGETYYANDAEVLANGPGGEFVTRLPDPAKGSNGPSYDVPGQRDSHFAAVLPSRSYSGQAEEADRRYDEDELSPTGIVDENQSRYSRDYQFTIASPDEEMHGKAVALFDFARENENELPLVEGQVIWVSYRHGQGWLVAEDPKTQESGLVPEEYVRLLRDIRGGWGSLTGELGEATSGSHEAAEVTTPTQTDPQPFVSSANNGSNGFHHPSIVSVFSTSSKDLDPYPQHLLGTQQGQTPPEVVHYHGQRGGSQTNTPTLTSPKPSFPESDHRGSLADVTNGPDVGASPDKDMGADEAAKRR